MKISIGRCGDADCGLVLSHKGKHAEFLVEGLGWRILEALALQADQNPSLPRYPVELVYTNGGLLFEMLSEPEKYEGYTLSP
jgi:hypothetical protein